MKLVQIGKNQSGGRLDKFLLKYLDRAGSGFIYKMLRKKNITLNGKKADGSEKLNVGDEIKIFLSDETFEKFSSQSDGCGDELKPYQRLTSTKEFQSLSVVYEDKNILLLDKPADMLSQKAKDTDVSLNEYAIAYLLDKGVVGAEEFKTFKPSVCNRLDRNTTGLITVGASMEGVRALSLGFKERTFDKYYVCLVAGKVEQGARITGYLEKNERNNQVVISDTQRGDSVFIDTEYEPLKTDGRVTLLKVKLITGKTHQIRAHLASVGHPIIGDTKYGDAKSNEKYRREYGVKHQLLHSYELHFPEMEGALENLSGQTFRADIPAVYGTILH